MLLPRSLLFVPGDRPDRFARAAASGAHQVIIDLEDAVDERNKASARELVAAELAAARSTPGFLVRVNGTDTAWHRDDVDALAGLPGLAGFMLPKAERAEELAALGARLDADRTLIALVESVRGYLELRAVAAARGLTRIAFGSADFCVDSGIEGDDEELNAVRTGLVLESRLAGLPPPVDGVTLHIADALALQRDVARSRRFGFGGKLCIHPRQVGEVNDGFAPSSADLEWARKVVAAAASGSGATTIDGKLVDKAIIERARGVIAQGTPGEAPAERQDRSSP